MQSLTILFDYSPWFILLCLLAGAAYAWVLYSKKGPWPKAVNRLLAGLRFVLVTLICILLVSPFLKQLRSTVEDPVFVIAVDNSSSVAEVMDSTALTSLLQATDNLAGQLAQQAYTINFRQLGEPAQPKKAGGIEFNNPATNLNRLLKNIQTDYEGRSLGGVLLVSDGIYNQGLSPAYSTFNFPVYTVGVGDTVPKQDLNLRTLLYNKLAYQGNQFLLRAEVLNQGYDGQPVTITVSEKGTTLATKTISLNQRGGLNEAEFSLDADKQGLKHLVVRVAPKEGEFTTTNNTKHAYIDIIEGKEKILLAASAPHPDIKAIKKAIEVNQNYELTLFIPGIEPYKEDLYDLVILHQLPNLKGGMPRQLNKLLQTNVSRWYMLGSQSNLSELYRYNSQLRIVTRGTEQDQVTPVFNPSFSRYTLDADVVDAIADYPPAIVPFGRYILSGKHEVALYQKVGSIETQKPLLAFFEGNSIKSAVLFGEGLWLWRLREFVDTDDQEAFNNLVLKTVQYLSAKEDKRKFKVYPVNDEVFSNEQVVFETEIYNDVYEEIYDQQISLTITDEAGEARSYNYYTTAVNSRYKVSGLPQGIYNYRATANINGRNVVSQGAFTVKELQLESLELTANHQLLRNLSQQTGGSYVAHPQMGQLGSILGQQKAQGIIYSEESFLPFIHLKWLLILFLLFVSLEWFLRKYNGAY